MCVWDLYSDSPEVLAGMRRGLAGETCSTQIEIAGVLFENLYFPQLADDGSVAGLLGVTSVMSVRREIELERQRAEEQLQHTQRQESLGVLAGGIAHDFNNLLVGTLGHADLALRLVPSDSAVYQHLREIVHSSERSADLCRQLLAYAGRGQFIIEAVNLNQLVDESIRLIELAIARTSRLETSLAPDLPPLRGDATQLAQVLINLMKNASDATEGKPSTIRLSTGVQYVEPDGGRFAVVAPDAQAGEYVFVRVRDEGIGMPSAVLGRIFDPFFSTKQTGRGLGLAAVVGIVRSHGGLLEVQSQVGAGTTMTVYFPVSHQAVRTRQATPCPEPSTLHGATLLLVDDELAARQATRAMLEQAGCKVIEAENGREAVDTYRALGSKPHAVLMDLSMPVMGGDAAFRELVSIAPDVRVILISGYTEVDTAKNLAGRMPAAFLQKPYRYRQLLDVVSSVIHRAIP
jgi:signal transduction histidine kinase/CheY-like chemotaxis protein